MKKILILILTLTLLLSGCATFNLSGFIMPDDLEFLAVVQSLDTPEKICTYIKENFTFKKHYLFAASPYVTWKIKEGDCNDFADFAMFIANYHGYETFLILMYFKNTLIGHALAVFVEDGKYTYSNNGGYKPILVDTFKEIVDHCPIDEYELQKYKVYDYENNLVEEGK